MASNMPTSGSAMEKLRWIFEMYDEDRSGAIGMSEMLEILSTLHEMEGAPTDRIQTMATSMFTKGTTHLDSHRQYFSLNFCDF